MQLIPICPQLNVFITIMFMQESYSNIVTVTVQPKTFDFVKGWLADHLVQIIHLLFLSR